MKRIKYTSRFSRPLSRSEILEIAERSAANNALLGITGVLMTAGGIFFQVIEGPEDQVDALFDVISRDDRHAHVLTLKLEEDISRRLFPSWSMRVLVLDSTDFARLEPLRALLETIVEMQGRIDGLTGILERAIWSEMASAAARDSS